MPIGPQDEDALQGKTQQVHEWWSLEQFLMLEDMQIRREDGDQQGDDAPSGPSGARWDQQENTQQ